MTTFVSDEKRIAKNTMYLYLRMFLVMVVTIYTSRVILEALGASDYGIYNVVGGVVMLMAFIKGPLNSATVRFLTYELGKQDEKKLANTFAASLNIHIFSGFLAVIIGETIGLWFFFNQLIIPEERVDIAFWVFQLSIINCFFSFTQVPYMASINSHENMSVYAYIGLYEAFSKLAISYLIVISPIDRLLLYAALLLINQCTIQLFCCYYSVKHYKECRFRCFWDKCLYAKIFNYAGWDTFGGVAVMCESHGVNILLNMFFGPVVNAARAIALQIRTAIIQFCTNIIAAVKPQVVKNYAVGNYVDMYKLVFTTTKFTYYLMLMLMLPVYFEINIILRIWLGSTIPDYTAIFAQLILIDSLIYIIDATFLMAFHAIGKIRFGNVVGGSLMISSLPVSYACLRLGYEPSSVFVVLIVINSVGSIFDFLLIHHYVNFSKMEFTKNTLLPIIGVTLFSILVPISIVSFFQESICRLALNTILSELIIFSIIWIVGLNNSEKQVVKRFVTNKVGRMVLN